MEMAWKMMILIDKVSLEREDSRRENKKEHKKLLNEILRCLSILETINKLLTEVDIEQKPKLEWLVSQFDLYLCYIHHMDIMLADRKGAPAQIGKTRTVPQKEENKG
jgi:hypothetical protein